MLRYYDHGCTSLYVLEMRMRKLILRRWSHRIETSHSICSVNRLMGLNDGTIILNMLTVIQELIVGKGTFNVI